MAARYRLACGVALDDRSAFVSNIVYLELFIEIIFSIARTDTDQSPHSKSQRKQTTDQSAAEAHRPRTLNDDAERVPPEYRTYQERARSSTSTPRARSSV